MAVLSLCALLLVACAPEKKPQKKDDGGPQAKATAGSRIVREDWGDVDGKPVELFTLENDKGTVIKITNFGAIIQQVRLIDRDGDFADVVLGFDTLEEYRGEHPYFGAIVGRCANRIADGAFEIDGKKYEVARNNGPHHLHGGKKGFDKHVWTPTVEKGAAGPSLKLTRVSPDGEEGYPGRVEATVVYTLTVDNVLRVSMTATTDAPTLVNLAQHSYWNLAGQDSGPVDNHTIRIHAQEYVPVNETLVPTGGFASVAGTPFDFREPQLLGPRFKLLSLGTESPSGYDHDFVVEGKSDKMRPVCELSESSKGRKLTLWSNQPGCQFYTGNFLDGSVHGKAGIPYRKHQGLCLETQHHPDSIHHPEWPTVILRPGETYRHDMEIRFGLVKD